jgi:hypothetical protein
MLWRSRRARAQSKAGRDLWDRYLWLRSGLGAVDSAPASCFHRRRGAGSAAEGQATGDRRLREALAGSRRRAVLQWRALDGRRRRARLAGGAARVVWWSSWQALSRGAADGCGWRLAVGGWLTTGAQRRVPIRCVRCVALRWSILLLGLAGTNNTKTQTAQGDSLDNGSRLTCVEGSTGVSECSA